MDDKRQKNQLVLAFLEESRSEAPDSVGILKVIGESAL
jgi:hypothetical protein